MTLFKQKQHEYCQRVNQVLVGYLQTLPSSKLSDSMHYSMLLGGKRIRPFLVYATGSMFNINLAVLDMPAAAIECIHAFSLIHDDLPAMDNDDLRRGKPTCHIEFNEALAILAGDALQTLAFSILSSPKTELSVATQLAMIHELARSTGANGMCMGQALDLSAEGKKCSLDELKQIHTYKTGALIRSAVRLGALAGGDAGKEALPILDSFANAVGLAFQIQDDVLDVIGDTSKLGKRPGADLNLDKSTYPALLGLEQAQKSAELLIEEANAALNELDMQGYSTSQLRLLAEFIVKRNS